MPFPAKLERRTNKESFLYSSTTRLYILLPEYGKIKKLTVSLFLNKKSIERLLLRRVTIKNFLSFATEDECCMTSSMFFSYSAGIQSNF